MTLHEFLVLTKKNVHKDASFLMNTLALSLLVMAAMFAFQPYLGDDPNIVEVKRVDASLITVHPNEIKNLLRSKSDKPVMLFMYASWCGYCKMVMPMLVDLVRTHQIDQVEPLFMSVDEQPRLLSKYLVRKGYDGAFTPYRLERDFLHGTIAMFGEQTGSHYTGTIPYIGFFNRDGMLISDATGVVGKQDLLTIIGKLQNF